MAVQRRNWQLMLKSETLLRVVSSLLVSCKQFLKELPNFDIFDFVLSQFISIRKFVYPIDAVNRFHMSSNIWFLRALIAAHVAMDSLDLLVHSLQMFCKTMIIEKLRFTLGTIEVSYLFVNRLYMSI